MTPTSGTTAPNINVDELIKKAKNKEITSDDMRQLAEQGDLSPGDFLTILIDGFDALKGHQNVGLPKRG